jgi:hypothetical protein
MLFIEPESLNDCPMALCARRNSANMHKHLAIGLNDAVRPLKSFKMNIMFICSQKYVFVSLFMETEQ